MSLFRYFIFIFIIGFSCISFSQNTNKEAIATRIKKAPKIDGLLNDSIWQKAEIIGGFRQYQPFWDSPAYQKTEVRILYDDNAVYVGAMMWDTAPDSILKQLGSRDDADLNADAFAIQFDTYNNQNDDYTFQVWASGVQYDYRFKDATFNAVWQSATKITANGWSLEIKIPYSALRFPTTDIQTWGLQMVRYIRRKRETDTWTMPNTGATNFIAYWGKLNGITNIKAPLRLSFTPYVSLYTEHYPYNVSGKSNYSESFSAGLDLKYGINESFTLDMTLLPDFSQVQSDNQVKNLTAFETVYDEQRPFFKEAVDLFELGGLFYSRRIGHQPLNYNNVEITSNATIESNPEQTKLLNAFKISGRNKHGLAVGFFNALTDNMYAKIKDSLGNKSKILTDPLTNYNIIVLDQTLKHNSSFYLINTNVIRDKRYNDANVTGSGLNLADKTNSWMLSASGALSQVISKGDSIKNKFSNSTGYQYSAGFAKINGRFHFKLNRTGLNSSFDDNDMGLTLYNNYNSNDLSASYNVYQPFWKYISVQNELNLTYSTNFITGKPIDSHIQFQHVGTVKPHFTYWFLVGGSFENVYDYYEPRVPGRYFISPLCKYWNIGISTDYRKPFAIDVQTGLSSINDINYTDWAFVVRPILRVSDKFSFNHKIEIDARSNDVGFAAMDTSANIIFGNRKLLTITNTFTGKYIFKNDLSLSLIVRHYWAKGEYDKYFTLQNNGYLTPNPGYTQNNDFNFNSFNIDLDFDWQFAPGSSLSLVWKNAILHQDQVIIRNFFDDFNKTFDSPQTNSLSLKVLYYLDWRYLRKIKV